MNASGSRTGWRSRIGQLVAMTVCALAVALVAPQGAWAATYQPDVYVNHLGEGVHDPTGTGQIKTVYIHRGHTKTLHFWNRNDGDIADTFSFWSPCVTTGDFKVVWWNWYTETDITPQVTAGTYTDGPLEPGWSSAVFDLKVKAKRSARIGYELTCMVVGTSNGGGVQDSAGYLVHVVRSP